LGIGLAEKPKVSPLKKSVGSPQPEWLWDWEGMQAEWGTTERITFVNDHLKAEIIGVARTPLMDSPCHHTLRSDFVYKSEKIAGRPLFIKSARRPNGVTFHARNGCMIEDTARKQNWVGWRFL
jgi:hypothetical protein